MSPTAPTSRAFQRVAIVTATLTALLVVLGGAVRATDSGLACPTWPGCFSAGDFVPPADLNVWLEHSHRLLAGVVATLIAVQLIWVAARYRRSPALWWTSLAAAVGVVVQALLGAVVVWGLLRAELVTAHLGLGTVVLALVVTVAVRARLPAAGGRPHRLTRPAAGTALLCWIVILVGGHLSGVGGGLAYADRGGLGVAAVAPVTGDAEATNVAHRVLALLLFGAIMALAGRSRRAGLTGWRLQLPRIAAGLVTVQVALGVANLASDLSYLTVVPHLAVASWLWAALVVETLLLAWSPVAQAVPPTAAPAAPATVGSTP